MEPLSGLTNAEPRPNTCNSDASDDATYSHTHVRQSVFLGLFVVSYLWLFSSSELKHNKAPPLLPSPTINKHTNLFTLTGNPLISITPHRCYVFITTFVQLDLSRPRVPPFAPRYASKLTPISTIPPLGSDRSPTLKALLWANRPPTAPFLI